MDDFCCVCKKSVVTQSNCYTIYSNGPDGVYCSQECMRTWMGDTKNAIKWMEWRGEQIKMWKWPEFVPTDVIPRCKICNGTMTLFGFEPDCSWGCGYCQTRKNMEKARKGEVKNPIEMLHSKYADYYNDRTLIPTGKPEEPESTYEAYYKKKKD